MTKENYKTQQMTNENYKYKQVRKLLKKDQINYNT